MRRFLVLLVLTFFLYNTAEAFIQALVGVVIRGPYIIRYTLPFVAERVLQIYNKWKSAGRPTFKYFKEVLPSAILFIGASKLLKDFEKLYQMEQENVTSRVCIRITYLEDYGTCASGYYGTFHTDLVIDFSSPCVVSPQSARLTNVSPCYFYAFEVYAYRGGQWNQICSFGSHATADFIQKLKLYGCPEPLVAPPQVNIDREIERIAKEYVESRPHIIAYPNIDAYREEIQRREQTDLKDFFLIPPFPGDVVIVDDTNNGDRTKDEVHSGSPNPGVTDDANPGVEGETHSNPTSPDTTTDTEKSQINVDIPDSEYDPSIEIPEEKDVRSLIRQFILSNPLYRLVSSVHVSGSGSCSVSGAVFNSSFTIDFCRYSDFLSYLGSLILAFSYLYAIYIMFKEE